MALKSGKSTGDLFLDDCLEMYSARTSLNVFEELSFVEYDKLMLIQSEINKLEKAEMDKIRNKGLRR